MEDVRSARRIEHVRPLEQVRERLTIGAVADETKAGMWRDFARAAADVAAPAAKRKFVAGLSHESQLVAPARCGFRERRERSQ
jgi:hypothetical protein